MKLLEEINKIQGERQADVRIKNCLLEIYKRTNGFSTVDPAITAEVQSQCDDCDCDNLRAELTSMSDKIDDLEEENDNLRAIVTEVAEEGEEEDDIQDETESNS